MRDLHLPGRSAVHTRHAMVATSHSDATVAALDVLRDGGNAIDAAICAAAVQAVVEPQSTGIGGDMFALYTPAGTGEVIAINASGRAPAAATLDWYVDNGIDKIGFQSPHAVTVPGAIAGWQKLSDDHGKLGLARLLAPAIAFARDGYVMHEVVAYVTALQREKLAADANASAVFLPGGEPVPMGALHTQPRLADTMQAIAEGGRDAFYTGPIAQDMVASLNAVGGLHTIDDFAAATADYVSPIKTDYRGHTIYECPPNGQGIIALQMLNILSGFDLASLDPLGIERFHLEGEATRLAYRDRAGLLADPDHVEVPVETMLSPAYAEKLRARISRDSVITDLPPPGETAHRDTVYISIVDSDGNAVSFINSLFQSFGTALMSKDSGVMFHNRGSGFVIDPAHPNRIAPGKRPLHTIIPGMVIEGGRAAMPFGVMGGHFQPVGHTHFLTNVFDFGMSVQEALDCPRGFAYEGKFQLERGVPRATADGLAKLGHTVVEAGAPLGGGQAVAINPETGVLSGGSDPRKDGCAMGF